MATRSRSIRHSCGLAGALLLIPGCTVGPGILGDATETDGAGTATQGQTTADGTDTEAACVEDCDPDFAVASFSGTNLELRRVHLLGSDTCTGPACPTTVEPPPFAGQPVQPCLESEQAQQSPMGPAEYCRISAVGLSTASISFQTPVERGSFEEVRPRLDDPLHDEPYLWHPSVVRIEGPGTAFRGDYRDEGIQREHVVDLVNETCADRLTALGIPWTEGELETLCVGVWDDGGELRPLRMNPSMVFRPNEGELSNFAGLSCDTPDNGPDACCSPCDFVLSTAIARYGVDGSGVPRNPNLGTAITCDPGGDPLIECRDLVLAVDRSDEPLQYDYAWDGGEQSWSLPWYDKIRETHPDERPASVEELGRACASASECDDGQQCIGTDPAGAACSEGVDCVARACRAEWFGTCGATTGSGSYCHDRRFDPRGAGACLAATTNFGAGSAGDRLAQCDANEDGLLSSQECCDPALGGAADCDPFAQSELAPVDRYDRDATLPTEAHCTCSPDEPASCEPTLDQWCEAPVGSHSGPGPAAPDGAYAIPTVSRKGGTRWDDTDGAFDLRIAKYGNLQRSMVEACAESRGIIGDRSPADGWLGNTELQPSFYEDHDLELCSGSTYHVFFAESDAEHHITSAAGGNLDGRSEHVLETAQFRVVPSSLFPTDNLMILACDPFTLQFSAQYDLGRSNLLKISLHEGDPGGPRVAGGVDCDPGATPEQIAAGAIPCLTVDVSDRFVGMLRFYVDREVHGQVLVPGTTYAVVVPGLADIGQLSDATAYAAAFHDACGMPLVLGDTPEQVATAQMGFTIDGLCP